MASHKRLPAAPAATTPPAGILRQLKRLAAGPQHGGDPEQPPAVRLSARHLGKIKMLATLRGESFEAAYRRTIANLLHALPMAVAPRNLVRELDLKSVELKDGLVRLELGNGRVFWSYPSRFRYMRIYLALRDLIPRAFTAETYQAGVDVAARYLAARYPCLPAPGSGGVIIEGGAFIGYKAIRFAEIVGDGGKVIAIEIGRAGYELMCRNVSANSLGHIITPLHCGIWKEPGQLEALFQHANAYHLAPNEEHDWISRSETVPTNTLDNIIDAHNLQTVDFLNLQLNGAEYEGLLGLERRFNDVKVIRAAAYYTRNGQKQVDVVADLLRKRGCTLVHCTKRGAVLAITPKFTAELSDRFHRLD